MIKQGSKNISQNIIIFFLSFSILLLTVNFKTGYGDGNFNLYAALLRSQIWFIFIIFLTILIQPRLLFLNLKKINFDSKFLIIAPFAFLILSLISTFYAILAYQKSIGFLGFTESLEVITAALISLISFNLINQNTKALKWIVISLIAMPALNMIAVLILTNQHVEFLGGNSGYTLVWYLGYGNRFIGLASNSNLIAIQAVVAISFIIAYFDSSENKSRKLIIDIKTIFLLIYIIGLIVMLLLTAVRAGILSLFVIYFASIFLAKKRIVFKLFFSFIVILIMLVAFAIVGGDFFIVLEDRIKNSGDGRLTIWRWYLELLSENLMGFGYAFEEIVNTSQVNTFELNRQRLTPHNAFINAWVYAGFLGFIFVCFYVFSALLNIFKLLANRNTTISYELHGASLAWVGLITILFFGGQIFGDPFSAILISILASGIHKFKNLKN